MHGVFCDRLGPTRGLVMDDLTLTHCTVDMHRGHVTRAEGMLKLTTKEVELLAYMVARPHVLVTREELLVAVWGYAPGVVSRAADTAIRRLRSKVENDPQQPDHVMTVYGEGYRFVPMRTAVGREASSAAAVPGAGPLATPQVGHGPAASTEGLFGRQNELDSLSEAFGRGGRLISVVGPGGMGKSRLASAFTHRQGADFPGGVLDLDLVEMDDVNALLDRLARELCLHVDPTLETDAISVELVEAAAALGDALLVLDNFDGLVSTSTRFLSKLLSGAPRVRILLTSRTRPRMDEGSVFVLESLSTEAAVALFVEQAGRIRPGYAPDADGRATIEALVARLDCMPLAITLAAARVRLMSPEQLLIRLSHSYSFLHGHPQDAVDRHHGIDAMLATSWEQTSADERLVLAAFSYFRGGGTVEALEAIALAAGVEGSAIDLVESLVDSSWICFEENAGPNPTVRFRMYETIRAFVQRQPETEACRSAVCGAHILWYVKQSERRVRDVVPCRRAEDLAWLSAERDNLLIAAQRARPDDVESDVSAMRAVMVHDRARGAVIALRSLMDQPTPALRDVDPAVIGWYFSDRSRCQRLLGRTAEAADDAAQALTAAEASGEPELICAAHLACAWVCWDRGDVEALEAHLAQMERHEPDAGAPRWTTQRLLITMQLRVRSGALEEARHLGLRGLELAGAHDQHATMAQLHHTMSVVSRELGHLDAAIEHCEKAMGLYEGLGDTLEGAGARNDLAMLVALGGRVDEAMVLLEQARDSFAQLGFVLGTAIAIGNQGAVQLFRGELTQAEALLRRSLDRFDIVGVKREKAFYQAYLGSLVGLRGDQVGATALFTEARERLHASGYAWADAFLAPLEAHADVGEAVRMKTRGEVEATQTALERAHAVLSTSALGTGGPRPSAVQWAHALLRHAIERQDWR
jgi:predicted ATPase/DNA-binding winged helix-turn-helix (wHTH) protein